MCHLLPSRQAQARAQRAAARKLARGSLPARPRPLYNGLQEAAQHQLPTSGPPEPTPPHRPREQESASKETRRERAQHYPRQYVRRSGLRPWRIRLSLEIYPTGTGGIAPAQEISDMICISGPVASHSDSVKDWHAPGAR